MAPLIRRVLLVTNPASRRGLRHRSVAVEEFRHAGITVDEMITEHPGDAGARLTGTPLSGDAVIVLGGDGTVMEVATALRGTGIPIGVLPGGTGNLVAGALGMSGNVRRAVRQLVGGAQKTFDLGRMGDGRCFAFAAGVGIDVDMVLDTSPGLKRVLGRFAYVIAATRSALRRRSFDVTAEVDGVVIRERAVLAMVANAGSLFGGRLALGPGIAPDDGELDLCLFTPATFAQVIGVALRAVRRDFSPHPHMRFVRGRSIRLSTEPRMAVQADGDVTGRTPVEITVEPRAAVFLVPGRRVGG